MKVINLKLIHYLPDQPKIRFLQRSGTYLREKLSNYQEGNMYLRFINSRDFLKILNSRLNAPDAVIIMAHGSNDSISKINNQGNLEPDIKCEHTPLFRGKFVFAFSCCTSNVLGAEAIKNRAIVYIGFNSLIGQYFEFDVSKYDNSDLNNGRIKQNLEKIFENIYVNGFNYEFLFFLKECLTAKEFYINLKQQLEIVTASLLKMNVRELNKTFSTDFRDDEESDILKIISMEFIQKFSEINERMTFSGDDNYIPWYFLSDQSPEHLIELLEKAENINEDYYKYKHFVLSEIYRCLNDRIKYEQLRELLEPKLDSSEKSFFTSNM